MQVNGKVSSQIVAVDFIKIQINKYLHNKENKCTLTDEKGKKIYPNFSKAWEEPTLYSLEQVKEIIFSGKTIKFGCQEDNTEKNRNESVNYSYGTYIDIDDITNKELFNQIISDPITCRAFLVHHSYSSSQDHVSIHICFVYDSIVESWQKQTEINRKLYSYYKDTYGIKIKSHEDGKIDVGCFNANRLKYGNDKPNALIYESNYRLNVEEILLLPDTLNSISKSNADSIPDRSEEIYRKIATDLTFHIDWESPDEVFSLYQHEFDRRTSNLENAVQYDGFDPRNENKQGRSKSFVATYLNNSWLWRSRARNIGGTLPEYFYRLKHQDWTTEELSRSQWWQGIYYLYEEHGITDKYQESFGSIPKPVPFIAKWLNDFRDSLLYEINFDQLWLYKDAHWHSLRDFHKVRYIFDEWKEKNFNVKVVTPNYYRQLESSWRCVELKCDEFIQDYRYYPFSNGIFDTKTKQILLYDKSIKNTFVSKYIYSKNYTYPQELFQFLSKCLAYNDEENINKLINLMVLSLHGKLIATGKAVHLIGASGTGKSTVAKILVKLLSPHEPVKILSLSSFCDVKNKFYPVMLDNLRINWFEDESTKIYDTQRFKVLCPGEFDWNRYYSHLTGDRKIKTDVNIRFTGQTWITSERNIFISNANNGGEERRTYLFEFANFDSEIPILIDKMNNPLWLNNFLLWALNQDVKNIFDQFYEEDLRHDKNNSMYKSKMSYKSESDIVFRFMLEKIEYTGKDEDFIKASDLYDMWRFWLTKEDDKKSEKISRNVFGASLSKYLKEVYNWEAEQNKFRTRVNGESDPTTIYKKLKLKSDNDFSL